MSRIINVLCGVDGSDESLAAARVSMRLAEETRGQLTLVYVIPYDRIFRLGINVDIAEKELVADATKFLDDLRSQSPAEVETTFVEGDPAASILDIADERRSDLIVVGKKGLGHVQRWLLGSVATKIVLHSPCSVLVTKDVGQSPSEPFRRILCCVDGSAESKTAADQAIDLASQFSGQVRFAHVIDVPQIDSSSIVGQEALREYRQYVDRMYEELTEKADAAHVPADVADLTGRTTETLLAHADGWGATLLAVGSRGTGGFMGLRLGSTSHQLVRYSQCSVLISPRKRSSSE